MAPIEEKNAEAVDAEEPEDEPIVKELKELDDAYLKLEREFEAEERKLREAFLVRQNPLLKQRAEILSEKTEAKEDEANLGTPALKGFWYHALDNHPAFKEGDCTLKEWDKPVLEYLKDIQSEVVDDDQAKLSFRLDFIFAENPFFEETLLSKTYTVRETSPYNGETEIKEIKSTQITWKAGKDITVAMVKKKVKGGGAKKAKGKEKSEPRMSFFRTFMGLNLTEGGSIPDGLEMLAEELKQQAGLDGADFDEDENVVGFMMERDFELGMAVKDNIIPFAVRWYTGEACPEMGDDDSDDEESEEEDDDDDDDDDEEEAKPKAKGKSKKADKPAAAGAGGKKEEECKQQ